MHEIEHELRKEIDQLEIKYAHLFQTYRGVLIQNVTQEKELLRKDKFILSQQARIKRLSNPEYTVENSKK